MASMIDGADRLAGSGWIPQDRLLAVVDDSDSESDSDSDSDSDHH